MTRTISPELEFKTMTKTILVKYGAHLPMIPKKEEEWIEGEPDLSLDSFLYKIFEKYQTCPGGESFESKFSLLITLNGEFIPASNLKQVLLRDGDVVVLLPPVSGG